MSQETDKYIITKENTELFNQNFRKDFQQHITILAKHKLSVPVRKK